MKLSTKYWRTCLDETLPKKSRFMATVTKPRTKPKHTQFPNSHFLITMLRSSVSFRSLQTGKMVHSCVLKSGCGSNLILVNNLLHMYCSCFSISDALNLFDEMHERDVVSWNTMISGSAGSGYFSEGFVFYRQMKSDSVVPSQSSFVSILIASVEMGSFGYCRQIHGECLKYGFSSDVVVGNALLTAYVKFGDMMESRKLFDGMVKFDEVSIEILFGGFLQEGISLIDAFELFRNSFVSGVPFSVFSLSSLISLCASVEGIEHGIQVHGYVVKDGLNKDVSVVNSLITMYAKSYHLEDAVCLFDEATSRDIVTWNSLLAGYAFNSQGDDALGLLSRFMSSGMRMNESTFSSFLSCCATVTCIDIAEKVHVLIMKLRGSKDIGIDNIILTMYCRCRTIDEATSVFNIMEERDVVSYNLIIALFNSLGLYTESTSLLKVIQLEGFRVDEYVYSNLISSCTRLVDLEVGQQLHSCILKTGFDMTVPLGNSLLEMYSRCGRLKEMEKLFSEIDNPDVFSWNILLMGYTNIGMFDQSIKLCVEMKESGVELNEFSYCAMVDVCSYFDAPLLGEQIHARIKKLGLSSDTVLMNSIISMYSSWRMMEKASGIFKEIPSKDSVSWNAMICGYAQNGFTEDSLKLYLLMNSSGFEPNNMTFASILKSCADYSSLMLGLPFHTVVTKTGFESDITVSNSLITMYAKCGEICDSFKVFGSTLNNRDVITWNSMICAFSHHGLGREALDTFSEMHKWGQKPNAVTFVGILSACGHSGLVVEACDLFDSMFHKHGVVPSEEHYACMVDVYCRAGRLEEAKEFIESTPYKSCCFIWKSFLGACRTNENVELGEEAAEKLMQLQPNDSSSYVLLSNIYASAEKMEEKTEMRRTMGYRSVKKDAGYSWICS